MEHNCAGAPRKDVIIFFFFIFDEEANTTVPVEADAENDEELEFFFDDKVRKVWHKQKEEWYFSVVDVCQVLTNSADGRKYWNKLKQRLKEDGNEFWFARELQKALEYTEWRNFSKVIDRAINACENSGNAVADHFVEINKIVEAGATSKPIDDYQLSRYACYLIVQNGDSRKKVIALGQTYFAVKTRQQELIENFDDLSEEKNVLQSVMR